MLKITSLEILPFRPQHGDKNPYLLGHANIVLNDSVRIGGLRIILGKNGLFLGYPFDTHGESFPSEVVSFVDISIRRYIEDTVIRAYEKIQPKKNRV